MKRFLALSIASLIVAACGSASPPPDTVSVATSQPVTNPVETPAAGIASPFLPLQTDNQLERGSVFISESELLIRESYPVQIALRLAGELPTPCHRLRVSANPPDAENKILIEAYTVLNPSLNCIQAVKPFQETIELGSFPAGHYTVWVNGSQVGEFDS